MSVENLATAEREQIEHLFKSLEERGVKARYATDREEALSLILQMIPPGATVAHGSSTTLKQINFVNYLQGEDSNYRYLNIEWTAEDDAKKRYQLRGRLSLESEYYLGSVQAICEDGRVVGVDASGSRQAFYIFGPPQVIWVAGINKLVPTLDDAFRRVHEVAYPKEDKRMKEAGASGSQIGKVVIYENEKPGRIQLILVGESLGF